MCRDLKRHAAFTHKERGYIRCCRACGWESQKEKLTRRLVSTFQVERYLFFRNFIALKSKKKEKRVYVVFYTIGPSCLDYKRRPASATETMSSRSFSASCSTSCSLSPVSSSLLCSSSCSCSIEPISALSTLILPQSPHLSLSPVSNSTLLSATWTCSASLRWSLNPVIWFTDCSIVVEIM